MTDLVEKIDKFADAVGREIALLRSKNITAAKLPIISEEKIDQTVIAEDISQTSGLEALDLITSQANTSYGVCRRTGTVITGWQHTQQSIEVIMTTKIGSRLLRRWFGSEVPNLQDANGTKETFLMYFTAIAEALARFEPRYQLTQLNVTRAGADGVFHLEMNGTYYPRGHLGDKSGGIEQFTRTLLR